MADQTVNKELFLDILTKEEKEALLTKKMEEIRKKNEALRKRHEEIEADKRVAAKNNPNKDVNSYAKDGTTPGPSSPRKESKSLPGEDKRAPRLVKSGGRGRPPTGGRGRDKEKTNQPQGPPPDPTYNFLADRRREGSGRESYPEASQGEKSSRKQDVRRHPKNFGGKDFNNVKAQMRSSKERQERPKSGPPRTKMDLAMAMTGKERKQYMEWKAERDRVDQERLDRQKSNTGEWRRAWDAEKQEQDFDEPSSPQRTEPAKRPAGRIGSGRFDRGEREERQRGENPRQKAGVKTEQEAPSKPVGRGRARGRGRGRGRGDRSPRQRTFSDETRKVERQKDLLVVKIDNSGKDTDQSVEVEYWDDDLVDVRSNSAASVKSGTSSRDGHSSHPRPRRHDDHKFDDPDSHKKENTYRHSRPRPHSYSHSENEHEESWEDCPEDADYYAEDDYINVDGDEMYNEPLKLDCKLNPDAPEFTPTSPEFMKTPPGHVKVMDWVTEVNSNLSPTSPPPTMDGVNNTECKKILFKGGNSDSPESKKSSSHGGVKESGDTIPKEELSASHIEDNDNDPAPEAAEEFLDASGDLEENGESHEEKKESDLEFHDEDEVSSKDQKVPTPTHQLYTLLPGKTDDTELSDEPHADESKSDTDAAVYKMDPSSEPQKEEVTEKAEPKDLQESLEEPLMGKEVSNEEVEDEVASEDVADETHQAEANHFDVMPPASDIAGHSSDAKADVPPEDVSEGRSEGASSAEDGEEEGSSQEVADTSRDEQSLQQMAETVSTSNTAQSNMAQKQLLKEKTDLAEEDKKSSESEIVVNSTTPPPSATAAAATEDSHVESQGQE